MANDKHDAYVDRMFIELKMLAARIAAIVLFAMSDRYNKLDDTDKNNLSEQLHYMHKYKSVLKKRISKAIGEL